MKNNDPDQINQVLTRGVAEVLPGKKSLAELMQKKKIRLYLGIDPTGAFLHIGHGVVLRKLQQFAELGHEVILLVGNGTVKIGDPTGRDKSRPVLTDEQIEANFQDWKRQASTILDFDKIEVRHNGDWLEKLSYSDIVKLLAKTTVQQLLERDMFQERMKKELPIFGHEIIYPMLQGYDSVVMDVDLELGGTDQTFNMMMGRTLQKAYNNHEKWVLTVPLLEGTDGRKMSKSFNNYIALTDTPNDMFGKLMSIQDELICRYFKILTDVPTEEIEAMQQAMQSGENPMQFKQKLAWTITSDFHGDEAADQAQQHFATAFKQGKTPEDVPEVKIKENPIQLLKLLTLCMPEQSVSQLRRLIQQGAIKLMPEEEKLTDFDLQFEVENGQVLKVGKRKFFKLIS